MINRGQHLKAQPPLAFSIANIQQIYNKTNPKKYFKSNLQLLEFLHLLLGGEVVDGGVLDDRKEHKEEAGPQVDVHGFHIRHLRHGRRHSGYYGGHCQHCSDAWIKYTFKHML